MRDFEFTTETGSTYRIRNGIASRSNGYTFAVWDFKCVEDFPQLMPKEEMWELVENTPSSDYPEIGKRVYINGMEQWYITTRVVEITDLS